MDLSTESKLRDKLELKYLFVQLIGNLVERGELYDDTSRRIIDETKNFVYHSTPEDFLNRAEDVSRRLDELIADAVGFFPIKASAEETAREFRKLLNERGEEVYLTGVTFGWLNNLIDCARLGLPSDLPHSAKIGLWVHAGRYSVEENFLLGDAFFMLELTNASYDRMQLAFSQLEDYPIVSVANQNVCSAARLCVFSFYAFVEAFVNSIGSDFAARSSSTLTSRQIGQLHGKKGRRFLSLEVKMESFPEIIRQDGKRPIVLTDKKQHREPFLTFFSLIKDVRDASTHFGVGKENIWQKPEDWLRRAELASRNSVEVASTFWEACYPGRDKPDYLDRLNYAILRERAANRLETTRYILSLGQ